MMKKMIAYIGVALLLLLGQNVLAGSGLLFNVAATGTPGAVNITLCLNGHGPLSCQNYNVSALNLSISTTVPNHTYPNIGIVINTPGYTIANLGIDCTLLSNGYCLFSTSDTTPKAIQLKSASTSTYSIGGSISGLTASGLVLQNNGGNNYSASPGATSFQFSTPVASGGSYNVTVLTQPTGQTCTVGNSSGTNVTANVTNVSITCSQTTYTIGGTISGLTASGLVLQNNGDNNYSAISGATSFQFTTPVAYGGSYNVTVFTQPTGLTCTVGSGSGTNVMANVTNVSITCAVPSLLIYETTATTNGNLGGVAGADVKCQADSQCPAGATCKAMLSDGATRTANPALNWVLQPSTQYVNSSSQVIGTTTSGAIFTFPLTNSINTLGNSEWTGLNGDWTTNANTCAAWTNGTSGAGGEAGFDSATSSAAISFGSGFVCNNAGLRLYCVQQP